MGFIGIFLFFLARVLDVVLFAVFARVILSWFAASRFEHHPLCVFLHEVTEPLFRLVRIIPHQFGMIDISAIYVFILINILITLLNFLQASLLY